MTKQVLQGRAELKQWQRVFNPKAVSKEQPEAETIKHIQCSKAKQKEKTAVFSY